MTDLPPPLPSKPPKKQRSWWARGLIRMGIVFVILIAAVFVLAFVLAVWPDEALNDDTDLVPHAENIPDHLDNPVLKFEEYFPEDLFSSEEIVLLKIESSKLTESEKEDLKLLAEKNKAALNFFRAAATNPRWKFPPNYDINVEIPYLSSLQNVCLLLKKSSQEVDDAIALLQFGRRFETAGGGLIHKLISVTITSIGQEEIVDWADSETPSLSELEQVADSLVETLPQAEDFSDAFRVEYQTHKQTYINLAAGKLDITSMHEGPGPRARGKSARAAYFQKNQSINKLADAMRVAVDDSQAPRINKTFEQKVIDPVREQRANRFRFFVNPNAVGDIFHSMMIPAFGKITDRHAQTQATHGLVEIKIAALRFHQDNNRSINSLDELVPKYLPAIPMDPFDGKPLRFNESTRTVYSIGIDLTDSLGIPPTERRRPRPTYLNRDEPHLVIP